MSTDPSRARLAQSGRAQVRSEAARSRSPPGRGDVDVGERSPEERRSPGRSRIRALVSDEPDRCDYPDAAPVWPTSTRRKRRSPQTGELTGRTLLAGNVQQPGISRQSGNTGQQRRLCVVGIEGRPTPPTRGSRSNPHSAFTSDPLRRPVYGLPVLGLPRSGANCCLSAGSSEPRRVRCVTDSAQLAACLLQRADNQRFEPRRQSRTACRHVSAAAPDHANRHARGTDPREGNRRQVRVAHSDRKPESTPPQVRRHAKAHRRIYASKIDSGQVRTENREGTYRQQRSKGSLSGEVPHAAHHVCRALGTLTFQ